MTSTSTSTTSSNNNNNTISGDLIGAIDQGTSSSRFIVFNHAGVPVASHQVAISLIYPRGEGESWVEQDPMEIFDSVCACMQAVVDANPQMKQCIKAIGITNQRETTIVWDRVTGKPLYNAIVWLDQRSSTICDDMSGQHGGKDAFRPICGLPLSSYFSATKLKWLIDNVDDVRAAVDNRTCMFGTVDSWLLWKLTGEHVTDVTNASRTMLMDLRTCAWSEEMCAHFSIPMHVLPKTICSNSQVYGVLIDDTSPLHGVPIAACIGDQQAAMVGQLCFQRGSVKNTYGTGCFMLMNTGTDIVASSKGLLTTVCYQFGDDAPVHYALEGSVAVAGVAVKWMIENLGMFSSPTEVSELAATVDNANGMYFVPALSGLFAPYWRSDARGIFCGLAFEHKRAHFARAVIDAVCYSSYDIMRVMEDETQCRLQSLKVDGGMTVSAPLLQFQADILGMDVVRPACLETTAMGAAVAAGIAIGFWHSVDDVCECIGGACTRTQPNMTAASREIALQGWKTAVEKCFN